MLVLSRKKNESIVVNDVIVITVVEIRGDKVRLGIEAPREISIHRSEVYASIQANTQSQGSEASVNGLDASHAGIEAENQTDDSTVNGHETAAPR